MEVEHDQTVATGGHMSAMARAEIDPWLETLVLAGVAKIGTAKITPFPTSG